MTVKTSPLKLKERIYPTLNQAVCAASALVLLVMMTVSFINIGNNAGTLALLRVFQWDESYLAWEILRNFRDNNLYPHWWFNYGHSYQGLCVLVLKLIHAGGIQASETTAILAARLVSVYSYIVCMILFFKIQLKLGVEKNTGMLFTLFFASVPDLYYWSQKIHPDLLQMALILGGMYVVIHPRLSFKRACAATFLLGLSFGVKYASSFMVPFIWLFVTLSGLASGQTLIWREEFRKYFIISLVFLAGWLIPNPYVLKFFAELISDLHTQSHTAHWGYGFEEPKNPLLWFPVFLEQFSAGGSSLLVISLAGFVYYLTINGGFSLQRMKENPYLIFCAGIGLYCVITTLLLFFQVNYRQVRYSFPVLPFVFLIASIGYQAITVRLPKRAAEVVSVLVLLIIISGVTVPALRYSAEFDESEKRIELVQAGEWLQKNYPPETPIVGDIYSYFPEYFKNVKTVWGVNHQVIKEHHPQVIVINKVLSGKSAWKKDGTKLSDGQIVQGKYEDAEVFYHFQKDLASGKLPWKVAYEADTVIILEKMTG
jgi:hypothetical protein